MKIPVLIRAIRVPLDGVSQVAKSTPEHRPDRFVTVGESGRVFGLAPCTAE